MRMRIWAIVAVLTVSFVSVEAVLGCGGPPPNQYPVAILSANPSTVAVDANTTLDGSSSYDPDGSITKCEWDWTNDGSYDYTENPGDKKATHAYRSVGTYTAKLRVTDNEGATDTDTCMVTVGVYYVDCDATGNDNGKCWTDAYNDLQDALSAAGSGYEIWVAEGTYRPDGSDPNNRELSFTMVEGIEIYGGFDGTETARSQRDWEQNTTTLDGSIGSATKYDNTRHVVVGADNAVLDGFTITAACAEGPAGNENGGGMYNANCSVTVANCIFYDNYAGNSGGGIYDYNCSASITNCVFEWNGAGDEAGSAGGMCNYYSSGTITDCVFNNNWGETTCGGMKNAHSSPLIVNCVFTLNEAYTIGGAMCNSDSSPTLINCTFARNRADPYGYGIFNFNSNPTLINCILWDDSGSEITNWSNSDPNISYSNVRGCGGSSSWDPNCGTDLGGNIDSDPCFVSTSNLDGADDTWMTGDDGLMLTSTSPCIDAADGDDAPSTDIIDQSRIDDPNTANTGTGDPNYADIGAYEYDPNS